MTRPVVIVGAGLAGLSCARELTRAEVPFVILEESGRIGGKLQTDVVEGFRLDLGFQVLFSSYPNLAKVLDVDALELGAFRPGAEFWDGDRIQTVDQPRDPLTLLKMGLSRSVPLGDKLRVAKWSAAVTTSTVEGLRAQPDQATGAFLNSYGFSDRFLQTFLRPFLGGVFLDSSLSFSRNQFAFLWRCLATGDTGLPREGMAAIPNAIATALPPGSLHLYERATAITPDAGGVRVATATKEEFQASAVVLAIEPEAAGRLLQRDLTLEYRPIYKGMTALWFATSSLAATPPYLILNGSGTGIINNVAPISAAQPSYAPAGKGLIAVEILGVSPRDDEALESAVRAEIPRMLRDVSVDKCLRIDRISKAHLFEPPGYSRLAPKMKTPLANVYLAGEATANASIDGAIESGIRVARKLLAKLG